MRKEQFIIENSTGEQYLITLDEEKIKDLSQESFQTKIVDILFEVLNGEYLLPEPSPNQEYIGPRKGTTSPESSKLVSIFSTINSELRKALISIEKYTPSDSIAHTDPMTQETTTIADVIEYNNNIPNQNLDPEHLENRTFPNDEKTYPFGVELLQKLNTTYGLALNNKKITYFVDLFNNKYKRVPTFSELHIFAQANSEHCRHNIFNGVITIDKTEYQKSMFSYIKETYKNNPGDVIIAYADNGAVLKSSNGRYLVIKCETHNHPSMIEPFAGGATGSGGDYRDIMATGHGAEVEISTSAYCFGNILLDDPYNAAHKTPLEILIKATRGVNYYGNCFAAPMINGSVTAQIHDFKIADQNISFAKPIVMAGAAGSMPEVPRDKLLKNHNPGLIHIKLGGPDYKIGVGGAAASSMNAGENTAKLDFASVQRPDPQMQTKIKGVIEKLIHEYPDAIQNIHDYGAGGHGTNIFELAEGDENHPGGVYVDIAQISVKDTSMKYHEIMINESQERQGLLIKPEYLPIVEDICHREKCPVDVLGNSTDTGRVHIYDSRTGKDIVNIQVEDFILKDREYFEDTTHKYDLKPLDIQKIIMGTDINDILRHPTVGSKGYLINHVDRSVRGKVVQQQAVGPRQLPVADYAIFKLHQDDMGGTVTAQGQRPFNSVISPKAMVKYALTEAVFNTAFAKHKGLAYLSFSGNWMRSAKTPGGKAALYQAVKELSEACIQLDPNIPVGKDSLSMQVAKDNGEKVDAPGAVILSSFVHMPDVNKAITPNLKNEDSVLIYLPVQTIDKKNLKTRLELGLSGSIAGQLHGEFGNELPDIDITSVKSIHNIVQELIEKNITIAGHDVSEGGLYATLTEMYISGEAEGVHIQLPETQSRHRNLLLMSELPGVVLQIPENKYNEYKTIVNKNIESYKIGKTKKNLEAKQGHPLDILGNTGLARGYMNIGNFGYTTVKGMGSLLEYRNHPTKMIESQHHQKDRATGIDPNADAEFILPKFIVNNPETQTGPSIHHKKTRIAILRDEGTNGHHDMRYIWKAIGCDIQDVTMTNLLDEKYNINDFDFVAGPGGFSYGDVPVSGRGVASVIKHNPLLSNQFDTFMADDKKGSLRVCNGNQIQQELGYITQSHGLPGIYPMLHNKSKQFESRFLANKIINDDNIRFKGMKGDILGLRSAHGEGLYPPSLFETTQANNIPLEKISPIVFVDNNGKPTEQYPYNPNGSYQGVAGLISANGRHLSMMPHPERTVLPHQLPWTPDKKTDYTRYRIFTNAIKNR